MIGTDELKKRFYPQVLKPAGLAEIELLREQFMYLAKHIDATLPDGREKSEALMLLQDSSMWAVKGICVDPQFWLKDGSLRDNAILDGIGQNRPQESEQQPDGSYKVSWQDGSITYLSREDYQLIKHEIPE